MKRSINSLMQTIAPGRTNPPNCPFALSGPGRPSACVLSVVLLLGLAGAAPELFAQRVESVKEKTLNIRGVQIKKETPFVGGNYHYQMELINTTNETMVVDVEVAFSNDEIAESFEDTINLEPGETLNKDWVTKVHGTQNNSIVSVGLKKLLVRSARQVAEEKQSADAQLKQESARKGAADYARQQKVGEDWQKQMRDLAEGNRRAAQAKATSAPAEPVKFDSELIKWLLLDLEGKKPRPDLGRVSKAAQNHHWAMLIDAGLVDGASIKNPDGSVNSVMLKKITTDGRVFLTAIKDDAVWKQFAEDTAAEGDKLSAARLKTIAARVSNAGARPQ